MDPNEALKRARESAKYLATVGDYHGPTVEALIEHFQALDEWLSKGGFLPDAWQGAANAVGMGPRPIEEASGR